MDNNSFADRLRAALNAGAVPQPSSSLRKDLPTSRGIVGVLIVVAIVGWWSGYLPFGGHPGASTAHNVTETRLAPRMEVEHPSSSQSTLSTANADFPLYDVNKLCTQLSAQPTPGVSVTAANNYCVDQAQEGYEEAMSCWDQITDDMKMECKQYVGRRNNPYGALAYCVHLQCLKVDQTRPRSFVR